MITPARHHTEVLFIGIALFGLISFSIAQRVAPGVPPQQYNHDQQYQQYQQQPPQQQQYQQQNAQYQQYQQQAPQQHQQQFQQPPPQQQQQYQQPPPQQQQQFQQQPPAQQHGSDGHGHHGGHGAGVLNSNVAEERDHIKEHMEVPIDTSKMTEQELQFHYFTMHDSDKNNKLDGSELIKSLIHWHAEDENEQKEKLTDEVLQDSCDKALNKADYNWDGYISWDEYVYSLKDKDDHHTGDLETHEVNDHNEQKKH